MKGVFCPKCEEFTETTLEVEREIYNVRGEPVEIEANTTTCQRCKTKIFNEEVDSRNLEKAYKQYREKHNLLSPSDILTIREKYGLSQRALSRLLGWGEITIHRYENGSIQDNVHDSTLRFIENPENMRRLFETNRVKLPNHTAVRLEKIINAFIQEDEEKAFRTSFERLVSHRKVDLTSGFKSYELEKLKNMIVHLVSLLESVLKTKLNKLSWYCDFLYFKETSVSITGTQYIRLPYGPVPDKYDLITDMMCDEGLLKKMEVVFNAKEGIIGEEFTALVEPVEDIFSEKELQVINFVADTFRNYTSKRIMDKSHKELAYIKSNNGDIISYDYAKELSISLPK